MSNFTQQILSSSEENGGFDLVEILQNKLGSYWLQASDEDVKSSISQKLEKFGISSAKSSLEDGHIDTTELLMMLSEFGHSINLRNDYDLAPSEQTQTEILDVAKEYDIEDPHVLSGLSFFEQMIQDTADDLEQAIKNGDSRAVVAAFNDMNSAFGLEHRNIDPDLAAPLLDAFMPKV